MVKADLKKIMKNLRKYEFYLVEIVAQNITQYSVSIFKSHRKKKENLRQRVIQYLMF